MGACASKVREWKDETEQDEEVGAAPPAKAQLPRDGPPLPPRPQASLPSEMMFRHRCARPGCNGRPRRLGISRGRAEWARRRVFACGAPLLPARLPVLAPRASENAPPHAPFAALQSRGGTGKHRPPSAHPAFPRWEGYEGTDSWGRRRRAVPRWQRTARCKKGGEMGGSSATCGRRRRHRSCSSRHALHRTFPLPCPTTPVRPSPPVPAGGAAGFADYQPLRLLGRGGSGQTWLCKEGDTGKLYALKMQSRPIPRSAVRLAASEISVRGA